MRRFLLALWLLMIVAAACRGGGREWMVPMAIPAGWEAQIQSERAAAQAFMRSTDSPLTPESRMTFAGLTFFPPDSTLRFVVRLDGRGRGEATPILDNKGEVVRFRLEGKLHLVKDGVPFTLVLYRSAEDGHLFLPFRDETAGVDTYGMGRYLEVQDVGDGRFVVDFNRARNPYCAYDAKWICPVVPAENHIPMAIRAGETSAPHERP